MAGNGNSGRRKTTSLTYKQTIDKLRALAPLAMQQIENAVRKGYTTVDEQRSIENAWRVIEHVKGKPSQPISGEIGVYKGTKELTDDELSNIARRRSGGTTGASESASEPS